VVLELDNYFNQSLTWKHVASTNDYNEPIYTTFTIKGRKETGNILVRNAQGQEVVSSAAIFTGSAIANNDLIDGQLVVSVDAMINLNGTIKFYEVYLI